MSVKVKVNWNILATLKINGKGGRVRIGWRENTKYNDNTPVAKVAQIQEFGAKIPVTDKMRKWFAAQGFPLNKHTKKIVIPPRAFVRKTANQYKSKWMDAFRNDLVKVINGKMSLEQAFNRMGVRAQGDLKQIISDFNEPPNSPMTIAKKGFNNPLVDTGIMLSTVDYQVEVGE